MTELSLVIYSNHTTEGLSQSGMETLPNEIVAIITRLAVTGDSGIYNIPAIMLTCRQFYNIISPLIQGKDNVTQVTRGNIQKSLVEYYVYLGSQSGIDFAVRLGQQITFIHISTCLSNGFDITLDYILTKYGLPDCKNIFYTDLLMEYGTPALVDRFSTLGFQVDLYVMFDGCTKCDPEIYRKLTSLVADKQRLYIEIDLYTLMGHISTINKHENIAIVNYKTLYNAKLLNRKTLLDAVCMIYENTRYDWIGNYPGITQLAVDLYNDATTIIRHIKENNLRPELTKILANAPYLVINYDI